jgi:ABC-type sulfate/molybdate transport systems ATPase subunit/phosphate-selective porin
VRDVTRVFASSVPAALAGVSLHAPAGGLLALLGPSGSGKTTLLRIIAGLDSPDAGTIHIGADDVTNTPARRRGLGVVFQHYALFHHLTVFENIAFPLRVRHRPRAEIAARVAELLTLMQLEGLGSRRVGQLSGGQAQRVALARALAPHPRVLLLDEPFGALDTHVRQELREWLRALHDELHVTTVLVTHDRDEAFELADQVAVLRDGHLEQAGTPAELITQPTTRFVERFLTARRLSLGAALLSLAFPGRAHAQPDTTVASPVSFVTASVPLTLHIGGLLETESRTNDILLRRARIDINGTVAHFVDFRILPDFGLGTTTIQDSWIDVHYHTNAVRLQVGKFKEPVGLELIQYDPEIFFIERSLASDLVPNRDVGAQLHGVIGRGTLTWNAGIFDGAADGASADRAVGNTKDASGRLLVRPFALTGMPALSELAIGAGGTIGTKIGTVASRLVPTYSTSAQEAPFFTYRDTTLANGHASRATANGYWYVSRLGLLSEYIASWETVTRDARTATLRNDAWQISGSFALTDDHPSYTGVNPRGRFGAIEVLGRYALLRVDRLAFAEGFADSTRSARRASANAVGLTWTWNRAVRWQLNYERTFFEGGAKRGNREAENALLAEAQLVF